jgi:N-methylhydantoinase A
VSGNGKESPDSADKAFAVAVDIGGTFTDLVAVGAGGEVVLAKEPSVPADFLRGVHEALQGLGAAGIVDFRHGTTVGTNAIIQRKGARIGLITTRGFRDILLAARASRIDLYDSVWDPPPPLVARRDILTVTERLDYLGRTITPLDTGEVREAIGVLRDRGVEAVAVCFLNSFVNPAHELEALEIIAAEAPEIFACASSKVVPEIREFERMSTTVVNAYLGPPMATYLQGLDDLLESHDYGGDVLITHSGGGLMTSKAATRIPARVCQSGPAAGVMGGLAVAERVGFDNVITLDMGGTSADISVIVDGTPMFRSEWHAQFNVPIIFPAIDLVTIGAGGGTIAWVDAGGTPHTGPHSAGADPGPACYERGGTEPTNTDANVVLGRLRPQAFTGRRSDITLSAAAAHEAIERTIAPVLDCSVTNAAAGIIRLSNASMLNAVRLMTVERGYDPRDFSLVAFGGAGPLHAADLARALRIPTVVIPTYPGLVSAMGALQVMLRHDLLRPVFQVHSSVDRSVLEAARAELLTEIDELRASEVSTEWKVHWQADMRYYGQISGYLTLPLPHGIDYLVSHDSLERFQQEHQREFGYILSEQVTDVEIVNLRAVLVGDLEPVELPARPPGSSSPPESGEAYFFEADGTVATDFVQRDGLSPTDVVTGPAIVEEWDSTTVIPPGVVARVAPSGELVMNIGEGR